MRLLNFKNKTNAPKTNKIIIIKVVHTTDMQYSKSSEVKQLLFIRNYVGIGNTLPPLKCHHKIKNI